MFFSINFEMSLDDTGEKFSQSTDKVAESEGNIEWHCSFAIEIGGIFSLSSLVDVLSELTS